MNHNESVTITRSQLAPLLAVAILSVAAMPAGADEPATVDTSRWACKFCPFEDGFSKDLELGGGYVSDDSAKFGEYTGLNEKGGYVVASGSARYRKPDGTWFDVSMRDLGLDSRFLAMEGGKQGRYKLALSYKDTPHFIADSALSPFLGIGTGALTLPSGWVRGATTGTMSALAANLRGVDLETQRRAVGLAAAMTPTVHWEFAARVRHEQKTGTLGTAGSFVFDASQLGAPVDYDTNQIDLSAAYSAARLQARFAYYGSIFKNNEATLTWANPYVALAPGGTSGQLALAPSNKFHQLVASASFEFSKRTHMTADLAVGRMTQDEGFVPNTLNTTLTTAPLPRGSLDGQVDTVTANLRLSSALTDKIRFNTSASYDDRNNKTAQLLYPWVTTDTAVAAPRVNLPYSTSHGLFRVDAGSPIGRDLRLDVGYDFDLYQRSLQEVRETRESRFWGKVSAQAGERVDVTLRGAHAERTVSPYQAVAAIVSPENPLLRKYNMADRLQNTAEMRTEVALNKWLSFGAQATYAWEKYRTSVLGLLDARHDTATADATLTPTEQTSVTLYGSHEQIKSHQANAELIAGSPPWFAKNNDTIDTAGFGIKHHASDKLDIGLNYTFARSIGEIRIYGAVTGFPDLTSRLDSVRLDASYQLKQKLSLHFNYWYENYRSADWMLDRVTATTVPIVLSFGQGTPSYHVNAISLSGRYAF
ncbi:MAG: MtrB/PioB family decaheme-associated outer membrane protein [Steroidobacteraceae bacterium]